jgi:hypothetical protein
MHRLAMALCLPFETDLGDPSNFCDSACERCPLFRQCPVGHEVSRRLERMQQEDAPDIATESLTRALNRALLMVQEICAAEGVDPMTFEVPRPPPLVTLAETLGAELVRAAVTINEEIVRTVPVEERTSTRLVGLTTLLAVKAARVAWSLAGEDAGATEPIAPMLLLVERTSAEVRRDALLLAPLLPPLLAARFAAAHGDYLDFVTPWIAGISDQVRAELAARIASGCAPSPFCRCDSPPRAS